MENTMNKESMPHQKSGEPHIDTTSDLGSQKTGDEAKNLEKEKRALNDVYDKTTQVVGDVYDKTADTVSEKYEQTRIYSRENPGKTILIALGIGIGVGFMWGSTSRHTRSGRLVRPIVNAVSDVALEILR